MNYRTKLGQRKLGFSLLELSIVMLITAILVGAISQGSRILARSKLTGAQALTKSAPVPRISNLLVWWETTMEDSFIASEANLGPIGTWYNLSPSSNRTNNATQAQISAPDQRPVLTNNKINGLPALVFDGTNSFFVFDGKALANQDYSVAVVEQRLSGKSNNYYLSGNDVTAIPNNNLFLGYRLNNKSAFSQTSNGYDVTVPVFSTGVVTRIHVFRFNSSIGKNYYINGVSQTLSVILGGTPSLTTGLVSNTVAQIGRHLASTYYFGNIGEIIIFNKYINDDERKDVEQYLGKKWGIAI